MRNPLHIFIAAGPTVEPIDPVRFLSNRSTGYMGYELARMAKKRKHKVTLISGPTNIKPPKNIKLINVETARELQKKVRKELRKNKVLIMTSAVSDFRPTVFSKNKIKSGKSLKLKLVKNPDILKSISRKERKNKILIGFSLETENLLVNAKKKLKEKHLDLIVVNKTGRRENPFGKGKKTIYLLDASGGSQRLKNVEKTHIARAILDRVEELCYTSD